MASRVRQLIGWPSMTWVPAVVTFTPSAFAARIAPAITERAAFPVHRKTTWGTSFTRRVWQARPIGPVARQTVGRAEPPVCPRRRSGSPGGGVQQGPAERAQQFQ